MARERPKSVVRDLEPITDEERAVHMRTLESHTAADEAASLALIEREKAKIRAAKIAEDKRVSDGHHHETHGASSANRISKTEENVIPYPRLDGRQKDGQSV